MSAARDEARIRTAARRVGAFVAVGATAVIAAGVGILVAVLLLTARPDDHHGGAGHPDLDGDRIVVDLDGILPWVIVLGAIGVVLLAAIAWLAARRSVRPLADALRLQRAFVADASHEMRTPLTALSARVQTLQRRHERGDPLGPTISALRTNVDVLDDVLGDMLLAAEGVATGDAGEVTAAFESAVRTVTPLAEAADVQLAVHADGTMAVRMPQTSLMRVCVALLDNAIQHAPAGSTVTLGSEAAGEAVLIRVSDEGAGVRDDDRERIFDRFARGSEAGRRRGFGLGLALVRDAAVAAGGSVAIEHTSPAGTTVLVTLPKA
mgnify:FL=1